MSRRYPVPGALRRVARERSRLAAVVLIGVVALAGSGIQAGAAAVLRTTLDENWRGAYDILVTPSDAAGALGDRLPPNSLLSSTTGLTVEDLAAMRAVSGVEIAAPIGEMIAPGLKFSQPHVAIPREAVAAEENPQAYRVAIEYSTNDGLGERLISTDSMDIVIDESAEVANAPCTPSDGQFDDYSYTAAEYPDLAAGLCRDYFTNGPGVYSGGENNMTFYDATASALEFAVYNSPQSATRITLIDPVAEQALLGTEGDFLDPLVAFAATMPVTTAAMEQWAAGDDGPFGDAFRRDRALNAAMVDGQGYDDAALADLRRLYADNGSDYDEFILAQVADQTFTPLIVSAAPTANLSIKVSVESFGDTSIARPKDSFPAPELPASMATGEAGTTLGTTVADISGSLNPFLQDATANIAWPGTDLAVSSEISSYASLSFSSLSQTEQGTYQVDDGVTSLSPSGYRDPKVIPFEPGKGIHLAGDGTGLGFETAYTDARPLSMQQGVQAVPVGLLPDVAISPSDDELHYVPLGAYGTVGSTVAGGEYDGAELQPAVSGLGLVSSRTAAIASITGAEAWGGKAQISAVRVRVGGIFAYDAAAQQRVVDVARQFEELGFQSTIVAGSSPVETTVRVDGYAFGTTDPAGKQRVGTLGNVTQNWSELGAAARAELAISSGTLAILFIALASTVVLLGAVEIAGLQGRRAQSIVMREIGFTRTRISRWIGAEQLPGLVVVLVVGAIAVVLSGASRFSLVAVAILVAATGVTSAFAVIAGSRPEAVRRMGPGRSRRTGARSTAAFGVRQSFVHRLTSATHVLSILIVSLSAVGLVSAVTQSRSQAGESLLAGFLNDQQLVPQLALGGAGLGAGLVLARLGRRRDLALRSTQWATLRAAGWTTRNIALAQRTEGLTVVVPALVLAGLCTWAGVAMLGLESGAALLATSGIAGATASVIIYSARTARTTSPTRPAQTAVRPEGRTP
ncbi:hypothetical protein B0I08_105296 [Glaciihabitans tibetensis]|uniref:FtsX-like permease family protein n=1 Tax=Glaciihabitans tibetensis TaxID=1266600 RepID=A0A2T0VD74_9MICO|nr:hypothetical protein [Glaciihabitans tibetensis]PRY68131.1 hypothetical protein B0I08_105296 [Glaciihabitans tibetensis]